MSWWRIPGRSPKQGANNGAIPMTCLINGKIDLTSSKSSAESTGLTRLRRNPSLLKSLREKLKDIDLKLISCY
jgi:hypothetical protein